MALAPGLRTLHGMWWEGGSWTPVASLGGLKAALASWCSLVLPAHPMPDLAAFAQGLPRSLSPGSITSSKTSRGAALPCSAGLGGGHPRALWAANTVTWPVLTMVG